MRAMQQCTHRAMFLVPGVPLALQVKLRPAQALPTAATPRTEAIQVKEEVALYVAHTCMQVTAQDHSCRGVGDQDTGGLEVHMPALAADAPCRPWRSTPTTIREPEGGGCILC